MRKILNSSEIRMEFVVDGFEITNFALDDLYTKFKRIDRLEFFSIILNGQIAD